MHRAKHTTVLFMEYNIWSGLGNSTEKCKTIVLYDGWCDIARPSSWHLPGRRRRRSCLVIYAVILLVLRSLTFTDVCRPMEIAAAKIATINYFYRYLNKSYTM